MSSNQDDVPPTNAIDRQNATHGRRLVHTDLWGNRLDFIPAPKKKKKKKKQRRSTNYKTKRISKYNNNNNNNNNHYHNNNHNNRSRTNANYGNQLPKPQRPPLVQSNLHGQSISATDSEHFGHTYPRTPSPNTTIVTFQNIHPQKEGGKHSKSLHNARAFRASNAGVALIAEHCLNEAKLPLRDLFQTRMREVTPDSFSYITNNINEKDVASWNQTGGTGFTISHLFKSHKTTHGCDPTGLGRWSSVRFRGKADTSVRMISAYRPTCNKDGYGSVWNQQCRYFSENLNIEDPNPQSLFEEHLVEEIVSFMNAGDSIVLGVDGNYDVRTSALSQKLTELGLRDAILTLHAPASPPATYNRNTNRVPIDAIWVSPSVEVNRAGYCPFDGGGPSMSSDHRMLWVELDNCSILGKHLPPSRKIIASRLKSNDPRSRKKYTRQVKKKYAEARISLKRIRIMEMAERFVAGDTSLDTQIQVCYEDVHKTTSKIRTDVASHLRTLHAGGVASSPKMQVYRDKIEYWKRIVKLRKGVYTSRQGLKRLSRRLHIYKGYHVDLEYAELALQNAFQE